MQQSARRAQPWRAAHRESSCSPSCGASERCSSAAKLAAAPPSRDRQRMAMSMSTDGHTSTSASATPAKLAAMLMPSSLHHGGRPAGGLGAADGQRVGARSRDPALDTRNRSAQTAQRIDEAGSDHCGREVFPTFVLRSGGPNPVVGGCRHLRLCCVYRDSHDGSLPHVHTVRSDLT